MYEIRLGAGFQDFMQNPEGYYLSFAKDKRTGLILVNCEKRGIVTWLKAHLFRFSYRLQNVAEAIRSANNYITLNSKFIESFNSRIKRYNHSHAESINELVMASDLVAANHLAHQTAPIGTQQAQQQIPSLVTSGLPASNGSYTEPVSELQMTLPLVDSKQLKHTTDQIATKQALQQISRQVISCLLPSHENILQQARTEMDRLFENSSANIKGAYKQLSHIVRSGLLSSDKIILKQARKQLDRLFENHRILNPAYNGSGLRNFPNLKGYSALTVCCCWYCRRSNKSSETSSPFGSTDRFDFSLALLNKIKRVFPDRSQPLQIAALASGGCAHELFIHSCLHEMGYTQIEWTLVDEYYAKVKDAVIQFEKIACEMAPKSKVTSVAKGSEEFYIEQKNGSQRFDVILSIHEGSELAAAVTWQDIMADLSKPRSVQAMLHLRLRLPVLRPDLRFAIKVKPSLDDHLQEIQISLIEFKRLLANDVPPKLLSGYIRMKCYNIGEGNNSQEYCLYGYPSLWSTSIYHNIVKNMDICADRVAEMVREKGNPVSVYIENFDGGLVLLFAAVLLKEKKGIDRLEWRIKEDPAQQNRQLLLKRIFETLLGYSFEIIKAPKDCEPYTLKLRNQ